MYHPLTLSSNDDGHRPREAKSRPCRFMKRLPVEKPVVRNNYMFRIVDPTTNRPDDEKFMVKYNDRGRISGRSSRRAPRRQAKT
jgi:hypothetical protein